MVNSLRPKLSPMLATLAASVPAAGDWILEIKIHGYRIMARVDGTAEVRLSLITRSDHDCWAFKMPGLVEAIAKLGMRSSWLDEEVVVLNKDGLPDFNVLQKSFERRGGATVDGASMGAPLSVT